MSQALTPEELEALYYRANEVFSPSAPIDQRNLFAGRSVQLEALGDAISTKGRHAIVYGERGVGKTSLVSVIGAILNQGNNIPTVIRQNCHSRDTYGKVWKRAITDILLEIERPRGAGPDGYVRVAGFANVPDEDKTQIISLRDSVSADPSPDEIVVLFRRLQSRLVFVFDEFDQLKNKESQAFAETIKALSDYAVPSTIILVGVGDSVDSLIASHTSIARAMAQILMPRMNKAELAEIVTKALSVLGLDVEKAALNRIVRLSQGLPHYTHLLGLNSTRHAIRNRTTAITTKDVDGGINQAISQASQTILDAYTKATVSPQRNTLFKHVLLACALAATDDLGFFAASSVKPPLKAIGKDIGIPAFASHLNKFTMADRGATLQKTGTNRRFRYRFSNPLLQPYVVMRGLADGLITISQVEDLLGLDPTDEDEGS